MEGTHIESVRVYMQQSVKLSVGVVLQVAEIEARFSDSTRTVCKLVKAHYFTTTY